VAPLVGHQTYDLQVVGSSPGWAPLHSGFRQATHTGVPLVTKQYNLVPAKERLHSVAGKVTVGLSSHRLMVYPPTGSWPKEGRWTPCLCSCKFGMIYWQCHDTVSFAQILVYGTVLCRRGVLMLTADNVTVYGGEVDSLLEASQEHLVSNKL